MYPCQWWHRTCLLHLLQQCCIPPQHFPPRQDHWLLSFQEEFQEVQTQENEIDTYLKIKSKLFHLYITKLSFPLLFLLKFILLGEFFIILNCKLSKITDLLSWKIIYKGRTLSFYKWEICVPERLSGYLKVI